MGIIVLLSELNAVLFPFILFILSRFCLISQQQPLNFFCAVSLICPQGGMLPYLAVSLLDMLAEESVATALHYVFVFIDPVYIIFGGFYYIDKVRVVYNRGYIFIDPIYIIFGGFYYINKMRVVYNCGYIFCGFYYTDKVRVVLWLRLLWILLHW